MNSADQKAISPDLEVSGRPGEVGGSGATAPATARTVTALARVEALQLSRSVLVLAGLVAGGIVTWDIVHRGEPLWWSAAWEIGYGQLILSMTVLAAAQLAAGRAQRDGAQDLYDSLPVSATTRTIAHLFAVGGALPAGLVLAGAAAAFLQVRGEVVGTPNPAVLVGGVLLVVAGGTIGVAIGRRFPHPLAGLVGAIVWFIPFSQSNRVSGGATWLFPWVAPDQLKWLPQRLAGYPPAGAHAAELAGLAGLAAAVAVALGSKVLRRRVAVIGTGVLAVAVICFAGAAQLQPIPTADVNRVVTSVARPASAQHCTTTDGVSYCLYPGFGTVLPSLRAPVNGVLALLPARPAQTLTVSETASISLTDAALTHGHSRQQLAAWNAQLQRSPVNAASGIYVTVGAWPAPGSQADARFAVALAAAEWAVGLPTTTADPSQTPPCVPLDQAREAIAIWLATAATDTSPGRLTYRSQGHGVVTFVPGRSAPIALWTYPGEDAPYLASTGPQTTAAGVLLAKAMTTLPRQHVTSVLDAGWGKWSNWRTTDGQLAAALGIALPAVPIIKLGPTLAPQPRPGIRPQAVCAT
jgi:hypothetical protein